MASQKTSTGFMDMDFDIWLGLQKEEIKRMASRQKVKDR